MSLGIPNNLSLVTFNNNKTLFREHGLNINPKSNVINQSGQLHSSILAGDKLVVERLISEGVDINQSYQDGTFPLEAAVLCNDSEIVELLIQKGASLNAFDNPIETLLKPFFEKATKLSSNIKNDKEAQESLKIVQLLFKQLLKEFPSLADKLGAESLRTCLENAFLALNNKCFFDELMQTAVLDGHLKTVEILFDTSSSTFFDKIDDPIETLLLPAFENAAKLSLNTKDDKEAQKAQESLKIAQILYKQLCKELSGSSNKFPINSLISVICSAPKKIATDSLITHVVNYFNKTEINESIPGNPNQWTPLHYACSRGHGALVKQLIAKGAAINHSSLRVAVFGGHLETVDTLLENSNLSFTSNELVEILTTASRYYGTDNQKAQNLFKIAELLLESDRVSVDDIQRDKLKPSEFIKDLCCAPKVIDINNLMGLLIKKGLFSIDAVDPRRHRSLLDDVAKQGDLKRVKKLISLTDEKIPFSDATIGKVINQGIEKASRDPNASAESLKIAALLLTAGYSIKERGDQLIELLLSLMVKKVNHSALQKDVSQPSLHPLINQESTLLVIKQLIARLCQENTEELKQGKALLKWLIKAGGQAESTDNRQQFFNEALIYLRNCVDCIPIESDEEGLSLLSPLMHLLCTTSEKVDVNDLIKFFVVEMGFSEGQYEDQSLLDLAAKQGVFSRVQCLIESNAKIKHQKMALSNTTIGTAIEYGIQQASHHPETSAESLKTAALLLKQDYSVELANPIANTAIGDLVKVAEKKVQLNPEMAETCLIIANQLLQKDYPAQGYSDAAEQRAPLTVVANLAKAAYNHGISSLANNNSNVQNIISHAKQIIKQQLQNEEIEVKENPLSILPHEIVEALAGEMLFDAVEQGHIQVIRYFMEHDQEYAKSTNAEGEPLLYAWAASSTLSDQKPSSMLAGKVLLEFLQKSEINVAVNGKTAVDIASDNSNKAVLKILKKKGGLSTAEIQRAKEKPSFAQRVFQVVVQTPYQIFIRTPYRIFIKAPYQGVSYLFSRLF